MTATVAPPRSGSLSLAAVLLRLTITWNVVEGIVAVTAGIAAGSVALVGFGLDSCIEVTAALVLLWRLRLPEDDARAESREHTAHRVVGATFIALAIYIVAQVAYELTTGREPESSSVGLGLAIASLVLMPAVGLLKQRNARLLRSPGLLAESRETILCATLSAVLLLGLGANALFGWWWADIAAALLMVPWIFKEGIEASRGEGCLFEP